MKRQQEHNKESVNKLRGGQKGDNGRMIMKEKVKENMGKRYEYIRARKRVRKWMQEKNN